MSEEFENIIWGKIGGVTATANQATAPNGTNTADLITEGTSVLLYYSNLIPAGTYTQSWYAKKGTGDIVGMYFGSGFSVRYNLTSGTIVSINNVTATITNVGDGWYRCTATATPTASFYAGLNYANSSGLTIYAWGAQIVEGSSALPYFPTTDRLNVPRLSYMYGSAPALLLEPQRTNLALYSQALSTGNNVVDASTATANVYISPDGTQNAMQFTETTVNDRHGFYQYTSVTAQTYTASIFTKQTGRRYIAFNSDMINGTNIASFFDLQTISVVSSGSGHTCSIQDFGNGWLRLIITFTVVSSGSRYAIWGGSPDGTTTTYAGSTSISQTFWGYQLEAGAYPTTYIPTATTSATRIADSFSRNNIYTNGLITSSGGTWFVELRGNVEYIRDATASELYVGENASSGLAASSKALLIRNNASGSTRLGVGYWDGSSVTVLYTTTTTTTKLAIKFNGTTADVFANGTKVVTSASVALTLANMQHLNALSGVPRFIQQMALFPTPLSDDQCVALTSDFTEGESVIGSYERYVNSNGGAVENLNTITNLIQNLN
jgi:hypothetical protein